MLKRSFLIVLLVSGLLAPAALARTAVHVDRSFGVDGTVEGKFGPAYGPTAFTAIAPQPDGSLLATRGDGVNPGGWIRRYAADGTLDPGFPPQPASLRAEALDAEGRLLVSSVSESLERLNPDGTPDPSFGVRTWDTRKLSDWTGFRIEQIEPLPSGKILVAGSVMGYEEESSQNPQGRSYVEQVAVARFEQEGRLDATFGNGGVVRLRSDVGVGGEMLLGIEPRPGEGVAAVVLDEPRSQFGPNAVQSPSTFVALDAGGHLDSSFAAVTIRTPDTIEAFDVLADGSVTLAGERWGSRVEPPFDTRFSDVFVNRYTAAGQPDPGFGGGDGSIVLDLADVDLLGATLWDDDGSVWLGGSSSSLDSANCRRFDACPATPFLVRLTAAGAPDGGFDGDGIGLLTQLTDPYGGFLYRGGVLALAARPGGGVYAGGASGKAGFIAGVLPSGGFDPAFGSGGILIETEPYESSSDARAIATDRRGRLLVVGSTRAGGGPGALFRYLRDGRLDRDFAGGRGFVRVPGQGRDLALAPDGGSFVFTRGYSESVTKVREDGRVDPSYGEEGTTVLPGYVPVAWRGRTEYLSVEIASIAALPGGRLLLAGTASNHESRVVLFRLRADGSFDPTFGRRGTVIRSFGTSGRSRVDQMVLQRDGRILLAGQVMSRPSESPPTDALAVMRLLANGKKDRGFGRGGLVVKRLGQRSYASALTVQGRRGILVAGRARTHRKRREVLLRLRPDGRLDRGFGRRGIVASRFPSGGRYRPRQILLLGGRILVLRDSETKQLVGLSADGRHRREFVVARGTETDTPAAKAPFGTLQSGRLVLGWQVYDEPKFFKLQRLRIEGRP